MVRYYILFENYEQGLALHERLDATGIGNRIAPAPAAARGELCCGMSLLVEPDEIDAARALCLRRLTFFRKVILPQAAAYLAKPFREEIIRLVELTTVVGYVSVWDLTKAVDWIRGRTYESFFPIAFATLLYFILSFSLIAIISFLSKRFEASMQKQKTENEQPME